MTMSPSLSKFTLTAHIIFSAGWLGAVAGFLALAITGLIGQDAQVVRSMYIAMEVVAWFVIIPLSISSFLTGLIQSLGTQWGLFRHYWILIKFILTLVATTLLMLHMQPISYMASVVSQKMLSNTELSSLRIQLIADAGIALFVLLVATALSVYKPFGRIQFNTNILMSGVGHVQRQSWGFYFIAGLICLFLIIVILHLFGISLGHH
jgi:hypothetical protein